MKAKKLIEADGDDEDVQGGGEETEPVPGPGVEETTPQSAAERAHTALAAYMLAAGGYENDTGTAFTDLLADLIHWCDHNGLNFDDELRQAVEHYRAEKFGEDADDEPPEDPPFEVR